MFKVVQEGSMWKSFKTDQVTSVTTFIIGKWLTRENWLHTKQTRERVELPEVVSILATYGLHPKTRIPSG